MENFDPFLNGRGTVNDFGELDSDKVSRSVSDLNTKTAKKIIDRLF